MVGSVQAHEADACAGGGDFGGCPAEAVALDVGAEFIELVVRLRAAAPERKELHHPLVAIDAMEQGAVPLFPVAQDQPFCADRGHCANSSRL